MSIRAAGESHVASSGPLSPLRELLERLGLDLAVPSTSRAPTFSAIVRTQGLRPNSLREALASLAAQVNQRFDTIVAVHGNTAAHDEVQSDLATVKDVPQQLKIIAVPVGGTRSRPLNAALGEASGDYVVFLDDDDLAEPRWIEAFARGAAAAPGQIIRAQAALQNWTTEGSNEPRQPIGPKTKPYPAKFDYLSHFTRSDTPICSVAFPRLCLKHFELRFDESLTVCEDWDLLIRAALLLGVSDVAETTSLYRKTDLGNSDTDYSFEEWQSNRQKVIDKLCGDSFVLPGREVQRLADAAFTPGEGPKVVVDQIMARDLVVALRGRIRARLTRVTLETTKRLAGRRASA